MIEPFHTLYQDLFWFWESSAIGFSGRCVDHLVRQTHIMNLRYVGKSWPMIRGIKRAG
jgi:hypothetical protein